MKNSLDKRRKQDQIATEKIRTEAKKQVFRYIKRKYANCKLDFLAGDVFGKVNEPYRLWKDKGNQLETNGDYKQFIKFLKEPQ